MPPDTCCLDKLNGLCYTYIKRRLSAMVPVPWFSVVFCMKFIRIPLSGGRGGSDERKGDPCDREPKKEG